MNYTERFSRASLIAQQVVSQQGITALPVDPIAVAQSCEIEVRAKPITTQGVSGMLLRKGDAFGILYATHIDNLGFRRFSVAHELGHYYLPGHIDAVLSDSDVHESSAGFSSQDRYELEADHFAANLLMPRKYFEAAMASSGEGLHAIKSLAELCQTSLTATAIQFTRHSREAMAIVLSSGNRINYCFMSDALREIPGLNWIRKSETVPRNTATFDFNHEARLSKANSIDDATSDLQDWFGGEFDVAITEQVVGLGRYGKTLTVLTAFDLDEQLEEIGEEQSLVESWTPKFQR